MNIAKSNYLLNVREELFGATVLDLNNSRRYYITKQEYKNLCTRYELPKDTHYNTILRQKQIKQIRIKSYEKVKNFTFADTVFIEITRKCNLKCVHCLNDSGKNLLNELSHDDVIELIDSLSNAGIQDIRFTGGEALTNKYIYEYIEHALSKGIVVSLASNGTLITESVAEKLSSSGLRKCVISIDGTMKSNDRIRGIGSYEKALKSIEYLKKFNIDVRVNSVVMKNNIEDIISLAKELDSKKIKMYIRRFVNAGRATNLSNLDLSFKDYKYLNESLSEVIKNGYIDGHYLHEGDGVKTRIELPFKIEGCRAGKRSFAIAPNGDIYPCGFLVAQGFKPVSNIKNVKSWRKFWYNLQKKYRFNKIKKYWGRKKSSVILFSKYI